MRNSFSIYLLSVLYYYRLDSGETGVLLEDFPPRVTHLWVSGGQVYYSLDQRLCRADLKTGEVTVLAKQDVSYPTVLGDRIYYCRDDALASMSIDGGDETVLLQESIIIWLGYDDKLYFSHEGAVDGIYSYDVSTGDTEQISPIHVLSLQLVENRLYYTNEEHPEPGESIPLG